jgi:acyl-CoA hydrolase
MTTVRRRAHRDTTYASTRPTVDATGDRGTARVWSVGLGSRPGPRRRSSLWRMFDHVPAALADRIVDHATALTSAVRSGTRIGSGLGTSEPERFYAALWDHIRDHDLHDLAIRQALFMVPHPLLVGDPIAAEQSGGGADEGAAADGADGALERVRSAVEDRLDDAARLRRLREHVAELADRRIRFVSAFMGPATNRIVPDTVATRMLAPDLAGRNLATAGVLSWQPVHFPDAAGLAYAPDTGDPRVDLFVCTITPPRPDGTVSLGLSNGADGDILMRLLDRRDIALLCYVQPRMPWIDGFDFAPNTFDLHRLAPLARDGRLWLVGDDGELPGLPPGTFSDPGAVERRIAAHVVDHITARDDTTGRALQVGIGGTGAQIARQLGDAGWRGRLYTEMLDPVAHGLLDAGVVSGSHVLRDGERIVLDEVVVSTFAMGERGSDFPDRLGDGRVRMAPASTVLQPGAFAGGLGVNDILGIDFHGQVNATGRDATPFSGIGGSAVIHRGLADGGVAYLCLPSTHRTPSGERRSSIFPFLPEGTPVGLTGNDLMGTRNGARFHLATEHGVVQLNGVDQHELVRRLVLVADPRFRDELAEAAWDALRIRV